MLSNEILCETEMEPKQNIIVDWNIAEKRKNNAKKKS